jgi:hypothetical protein
MDTLANVIAQVTAVDSVVQFGAPDVQKTISCSNGDAWVISREWGVFKVNDFELRGIQGPNVGTVLPTVAQMYPYQPGDIMVIRKGASGFATNGLFPAGTNWSNSKYTVLGRNAQDDSVSLSTWELNHNGGSIPVGSASFWTWEHYWSDTTQWSTSAYELPYHDLMLSYPGEVITSTHYGDLDVPTPCIAEHRIDSLGRYCMECHLHVCDEPDDGAYYVEGVGLQWYEWSCFSAITEYYFMDGSVINGDTIGTINPDSDFLSIGEHALMDLRVYPIPANDMLTIEGLDPDMAILELVDVQGREVLHQIVHSSIVTVDISRLEAGFYSLSAHGERRSVPMKVVIVH